MHISNVEILTGHEPQRMYVHRAPKQPDKAQFVKSIINGVLTHERQKH